MLKKSLNFYFLQIITYGILSCFFIVFAYPIVYALYYSLVPQEYMGEIVGFNKLSFYNYKLLMKEYPIVRWLFNSVIVMLTVVVCNIFFDLMAGYALARLKFKGRNLVFWAILSTMMVPDQMLLAPNYVQLVEYGWNNKLISIIVPFLYFPFFVYLSRQFFLGLPYELEEAARIDGAGRIRTFFSVIMPISSPIMLSIVILNVTWTWNSYMAPATYINDRLKFTLVVGLNSIKDVTFDSINFTLATVVLISLPVALIFLALQKYFVQGIVTSGLKDK